MKKKKSKYDKLELQVPGEKTSYIKEGIVKGMRTFGYNLKSGGWSKYPQAGSTPARFVIVRWKRKKIDYRVNFLNVLSINGDRTYENDLREI